MATENFGDQIFFEYFLVENFFWATSVGCPLGRLAICTLDECPAQLQRIVLKFPGRVHNWAGWRFVRWMGVGCGGPCVEVSGFGCGWSGRVGLARCPLGALYVRRCQGRLQRIVVCNGLTRCTLDGFSVCCCDSKC